MSKTVFVTVGTTLFEELIKKFDEEEVLKTLRSFGYGKVIFQIGKGTYEPSNYMKIANIEGEVFRFKPSLIDDLKKADLIVSHCGAGTLLECLRLGKKIIAVNNDLLMHNHQLELLQPLEKSSYLIGFESTKQVNEGLKDALEKIQKGSVIKYPDPKPNVIYEVISELL